ncbi:hypothetical protein Hanom_Chr03g00240591 [Helianthus anomalus]
MLCTICSNKVTILSYYTQIDKGPAIGSKIVTRYDFFFGPSFWFMSLYIEASRDDDLC